jgi:anti-sigma B factor antagonist
MYIDLSFDAQPGDQPSLLVDLHCSDTEPPRMLVFGELDALSAGHLHKAVVDVLHDQRPRRIEMDLHGISFLDSAGIHALVRCQADAQQADCQITLTKPQPMVYRVLQVTGLLEHFGLTEPPPADKPRAGTSRAPSRPANLHVFN